MKTDTALNLEQPLDSQTVDGWYELAYEGKFIHPVTRKAFSLTKETFLSWKDYFDHVKRLGNSVPMTKGHSYDPVDRLGEVDEVQVREPTETRQGYSFWFKPKEYTEALAKILPRVSFSAGTRTEHTESTGEHFSSALLHVGVTDYPVLRGLQKQLNLSTVFFEKDLMELGISNVREDSNTPPEDTSKKEDPNMPFPASVLTELGLAAEADEMAVLTAVKTLKKTVADSTAATDAMYKSLSEQRLEKVNNLSIDDAEKEKLRKFCTPESVKLDLSQDNPTFDMLLGFAEKSANSTNTDFQSGDQNLGFDGNSKDDGTSLVASMKAYASEFNKSYGVS